MLTRARLITALEPFNGFVQAAVLYNLIERGVVERIVVDGIPATKALADATPERAEAVSLFLRTAGYTVDDLATDKLVGIWEARGWYQMMIGGYGQTFLGIGSGFDSTSAVPRDGRMVGVGSCEISIHDAIPLMHRVLDRRGESYRSGIDLGCGSGIFLTTLAERFPDMRLTGIEPSPEGAAAAVDFVAGTPQADRIEIVNSDAIGHLERTGDRYDFGIISFVIHEILGQDGEAGVRTFLRSLFDTNPGVELLVIDIDYCWDDPQRMRDPHCVNYYNSYFLLHPFTDQRLATRQYWLELFADEGLEVLVEDADTPGLDETGIVTAILLRDKGVGVVDYTDSQAVSRLSSGPRTFFRLPHRPASELRAGDGVDVVLLGVPIDGATGYRSGARFGPEAVRSASTLARLGSRSHNLVITDLLNVVDGGDIHIVPGYHLETLALIERGVDPIHRIGALPILVGGDHSLAIAELRAAARHHGPLSLVQIDAHRDVLDNYFGVEHFHGTVYRRAVEEHLIDPSTSIQIGMRGSVPREDLADDDLGIATITSEEAVRLGPAELGAIVAAKVGSNPIALTFDIDFVDPAYAPGTGTPEVGGPSSAFALSLLRELRLSTVRTVSLVEISPPYDTADITAHLGTAVIFEIMAMVAAVTQGKELQDGRSHA